MSVWSGWRGSGATARHHRNSGRADCWRQSTDFTEPTTAAAAARYGDWRTTFSTLESSSGWTHHFSEKESTERIDFQRIQIPVQTESTAALKSASFWRSSRRNVRWSGPDVWGCRTDHGPIRGWTVPSNFRTSCSAAGWHTKLPKFQRSGASCPATLRRRKLF